MNDSSSSIRLDAADPELLEKVVDHYTQRLREGQEPSIASYQQKFPQHGEEIRELLSSVAMIEQLKSETNRPQQTQQHRLLDRVSQLTEVGPYRLLREAGRGGMGVVFEAVHESLGRRVAIKVMPTPLVEAEKYIARFKREAQSAARLHHTNIVSVFGVGESDGFHYYVMDFVDGQCLAQTIASLHKTPTNHESIAAATPIAETLVDHRSTPHAASSRDSFRVVPHPVALPEEKSSPKSILDRLPRAGDKRFYRWAAHLGAHIADALAYAHDTDVLHRDIKPANLILDQQGIIWVADFGLAKDSQQELNLTRTGDVIGTPQYLAPESLEGKYDQRSETYCVGLTLYELVTGRPAYPHGSPAEVIRAVATTNPTAVRKRDPRVPRDLATIIEKCLARDPKRRYASARELRNDLRAFVNELPISARRISMMESGYRWARRNPLAASLSATSLMLLLLVAVVASIGYISTMAALNKEAEQSTQLKAEKLVTDRAWKQAEENLALMQAQYDRAEANISLTISAFDEMFRQVVGGPELSSGEFDFDGFRELAGIETPLTTRDAERLEKLLEYYEQFAALNENNERLKQEAAKAYRRVGNLYQLVGEYQPAIEAYQKSKQLYQPIWEQPTDTKAALLEEIGLMTELSQALRKQGNSAQAHLINRDVIDKIQDSPLSEHDPEVRLELARALSTTGFNLFRYLTISQVAADESVRGFDKRRPPRRPGDGNEMMNGRNPRRGYYSWGELLRGGRAVIERRNRQLIQQAIGIVDELLEADPANPEFLSVRATCHSILSATLMDANATIAKQFRRQAVDQFKQLVEDHPEQMDYRYLLAMAGAVSATPPVSADREFMEDSIEQAEQLTQQFPDRMEYQQLEAGLYLKLASLHLYNQDPSAAWSSLKSAESSVRFILEQKPTELSLRRIVATLKNSLRNVEQQFRQQGQPRKAQEVAQKSRELSDSLRELAKFWRPPGGRGGPKPPK